MEGGLYATSREKRGQIYFLWVLDRANFLKNSSDPVLKQTGQKVLDAYGSGNLTTIVSGKWGRSE